MPTPTTNASKFHDLSCTPFPKAHGARSNRYVDEEGR